MVTPMKVQRDLERAEAELAAQNAQIQQAAESGPQVVTDASQLLTAAPPTASPTITNPYPEPPAPPPKPDPDWQQKYRTLEGMYRKEVPELKAQTAAYQSELTALKEQVRALTTATQKAATAQPKVDAKDVEAFGADMVDMVQRYATQTFTAMRDEFANLVADFDKRVKALEDTVTGVRTTTESTLETQFYSTLSQLVPDWREINVSDDWLAWLAEVDPVYRVPRQAALDAAHQRRDVDGVSAVFKAFKSTRKAKPSSALESQVAPSTTAAGAQASQQPAAPSQMLSSKFVKDFYTNVAKGRYAGREAEAERIEAQINQAAAEGRIV